MRTKLQQRRASTRLSRRKFLQFVGLGALAGCSSSTWAWLWSQASIRDATQDNPGVFKRGAPDDATFEAWRRRGWVREAEFYIKRGTTVQCSICPNRCILEPGDRSHCRTRVNRDGTLYTLAYANPCTFHIDPVEKKPLFHFLPGSRTFSLAIAGCVLRCMNCQNWEISQKRPEDTKRADGPEFRLKPGGPPPASLDELARMSLFPEDVVANARASKCEAIAYTYSEPIAWFEYTLDTAKLARAAGVRNILVTSGYIRPDPLRELAQYIDAAHVDLKGFDEETYMRLNSGHLQPVLDAILTLKSAGVWVEIINLIVPTYTDNVALIRQMCGWIAEKVGPDVPLHFSRFHPAHRLTHLPPTPVETLLAAREQARAAGLRYVYIGNVRNVPDAGTTYCPNCRKPIILRDVFTVVEQHLSDGKCEFCRTPIAGIWA
ncbi:MAG: AmmeMemoRadiSam system radical SAM enzyme [Candidatus Hydrogenedentota bacterium]|nr:MAG: AmmeMemoRadiSam system radical SAM enzyme [Candidatus Hydrogenedentota bacterium]